MKYFTKICEMCGKEFKSKSSIKRFCNNDHYGTCCICKKQFKLPSNNLSYYFDRIDHIGCSPNCRHQIALQTSGLTQEEINRRRKQSMIDKYGVVNPGQLKSSIEKRRKTNLEKYGVSEASQAPEVIAKRKQTCLRRYGVEYVTQSEEFKEKSKQTCLDKYGVEYVTQSDIQKQHAKETMLQRYGVEHALRSSEILDKRRQTYLQKYGVNHPMELDEIKQKIKDTKEANYGDPNYDNPQKKKQTCLDKYGVEYYLQSQDCKDKTRLSAMQKYGVDHHLKALEVQQKRIKTCLERYSAKNIFASEFGKHRVKQGMLSKYGVENPSQHPELRAKAIKNSKNSKLELKISNLLDNYNIKYIRHYCLRNDEINCSHEFDFYLPKYKLLLDADGLYFHSYLDDPNGKQSNDYWDDIRISLVPKDHIFHVIVEGTEENQIKQIVKILEDIDNHIFDYDSYLFDWCRSIQFPYPNYSFQRLKNDWNSLCKYQPIKYVPQCRIGESLIKQFHKSIYECKRQNCVSPITGWYDDTKLKKVIKNRLIYINNVDPSKILRGFNISKICPVVSIFNPILTKYLITKYLSDFNEIFDPFSGFSGRLLGAISTNKTYIGQDLNPKVIQESNQIMQFLNISSDRYQLNQKDILDSNGKYECILTCPPYYKKEIYNEESVFKICDDWIDECLQRFKCKRYVFVVDTTNTYSNYVVETLKSTSHFSNVRELVIVIDGKDIEVDV